MKMWPCPARFGLIAISFDVFFLNYCYYYYYYYDYDYVCLEKKRRKCGTWFNEWKGKNSGTVSFSHKKVISVFTRKVSSPALPYEKTYWTFPILDYDNFYGIKKNYKKNTWNKHGKL